MNQQSILDESKDEKGRIERIIQAKKEIKTRTNKNETYKEKMIDRKERKLMLRMRVHVLVYCPQFVIVQMICFLNETE